jgi:titin
MSLESAGNNVVAGNYLGLALDGVTAVGNRTGIRITAASDGNRIGTDGDGVNDAAERNIISAAGLVQQNNSFGLLIDSGSDGNWIAGNYIGTDASGTLDRGNASNRITTGGLTIIGTNGDGLNDDVEGNLIAGNGDGLGNDNHGVVVPDGADGHILAGNRIGTDLAGANAIANGQNGVHVSGTGHILSGNLIAGNGGHGFSLSDAFSATVTGNLIGVALDGVTALGVVPTLAVGNSKAA